METEDRSILGYFKLYLIAIMLLGVTACGYSASEKSGSKEIQNAQISSDDTVIDESQVVHSLTLSPKAPKPGEPFRLLAIGGQEIKKAVIRVTYNGTELPSQHSRLGNGLPFWRIDEYPGSSAGNYQAELVIKNNTLKKITFVIAQKNNIPNSKSIWDSTRSWTNEMEGLYSAWVNALFFDATESTSWAALHEVTQNKDQNFLHNYLSLNEDNATEKNKVIMQPDCADNPFFLRAYFAWKLGLPFGYHETDRGYLGRAPQTGPWITNNAHTSKSQTTLSFNGFLRNVMNGVHSGTARTALKNETSDYYPVDLTRNALRPGLVYADPYGHTLILVKWIPQTENHPGTLLAVDAQPDKTIAIKRFWKGNFLFNTSEVIGEPGFKAFRPIVIKNNQYTLLTNNELDHESGFSSFSLRQQKLKSNEFYLAMDRAINPKPLDPETALLDLIQALHEQLQVRVKSVETGEVYMKAHPGVIIPMPSRAAGVFQTGGIWEDFSTPNRDLRLLIAIDAVLDFPDRIVQTPEDFKMPKLRSSAQVKSKLEALMNEKLNELSITYTRTDGVEQKLSLAEIVRRRDGFEIGYNPNDGIEIRWGAPENSAERASCRRHVPAYQHESMNTVRIWFQKRLHPPT